MQAARHIARTLLGALAAGAVVASPSFADETADSFDTPIKTVSVELGPSPYYNDPKIRTMLTCYYYPHLVIKEYSDGGTGAALSLLRHRGKPPACERALQRGERVIDSSEWDGFFKGVKDTLVFFDPNDSFNGDSPFAVFDSVSGKMLFQDSAYAEPVPSASYNASRVRVTATKNGYSLRYLRVAYADCNLHAAGSACWDRTQAGLGLRGHARPVCTGYEHIAEIVWTDDVESILAYPVEVSLLPSGATVEVAAGPLKCWPTQ